MITGIESPQRERLSYLDNIRSLIIIFVVLFHAVLPYSQACPWWYVVDTQPIPQAITFIIVFDVILMPILFFISGLLAMPSYLKKGPYRFMVIKVKRLLAPFLLCTILFSPILPFIRQHLRFGDSGVDLPGFWDFWISYLESGSEIHAGPVELNPDLVVTQYWFLLLLFVFFFLFVLYNLLRYRMGETHNEREQNVLPTRTVLRPFIVIFVLVTALAYVLATHFIASSTWVTLGSLLQIQPAKVPIYLAFFILGIQVERRDLLSSLLGLGRPATWLALSALLTTAYLAAVFATFRATDPSTTVQFASRILRIFFLFSVTLLSLSFFHRYLNGSGNVWGELSRNSYNIYLIHLVPLVVLQMLALSLPVSGLWKFTVVSLLTLIVSYLLSRFLVRKSTLATILGMVMLFCVMCLVFR